MHEDIEGIIKNRISKCWEQWNKAVFRINKDKVCSLDDFIMVLGRFFKEFYKRNPSIGDGNKRLQTTEVPPTVFRGESMTFKTYLTPSICRHISEFTPCKNGLKFTKEEYQEIQAFQSSNEGKDLMKDYGISEKAVDWILLAQHYGWKTRLLDVTKNGLIALYFACNEHLEEDGWVFIFPSYNLRRQTVSKSKIKKGDTEEYIAKVYWKLFETEDNAQAYLLDLFAERTPIYSRKTHRKIIAQQAAFVWWLSLGKNPYENITNTIPILIDYSTKKKMLQQLKDWFDIDKDTLCL